MPGPSASSVEKLGRHLELDGARGLAVIMVVFWHYAGIQTDAWAAGIHPLLTVPLRLTWSGVDLFFVLSGYLISRQLWAGPERRISTPAFYLNRVRRIVPLYLLMIGVYLLCRSTSLVSVPALMSLFQRPLPLWPYLTFTQNYYMVLAGVWGGFFLAVTWSVAIEMQFYALAPWLAKVIPLRRLPWACLAGILLALLCRTFNTEIQNHILPSRPHRWLQSYLLLPWRGDALLIGALLSWAEANERFRTMVRRFGVAGIVLTGSLAWLAGWGSADPYQFNYLFDALFYGALVAFLLVNKTGPLAAVFRWEWLRLGGRISYGIYLFHVPMLHFGYWLVPHHTWYTGASAVLTVALAWVSYTFYESRFLPKKAASHRRPAEIGGAAPVKVK